MYNRFTASTSSCDIPASRPSSLTKPASHADSSFRPQIIRFYAAVLLLLGGLWLLVSIALYIIVSQLTSAAKLFEARWLVSPLLLLGVLLLILIRYPKYESIFIAVVIMCVFACVGCFVAFILYSLNISRIFGDSGVYSGGPSRNPVLHRVGNPYRPRYVQACTALLLITGAGLIFGVCLGFTLFRLAQQHVAQVLPTANGQYYESSIASSTLSKVFTCGVVQLAATLISLMTVVHVVNYSNSFLASYTPTYVVDELHCCGSMLVLAVWQILFAYRSKSRKCERHSTNGSTGVQNGTIKHHDDCSGPNRLLLKCMFVLSMVQFIQELSHTWNAYILTMFAAQQQEMTKLDQPENSRSNSESGSYVTKLDVLAMPINFCSHFARMNLSGFVPVLLYQSLGIQRSVLQTSLHRSTGFAIKAGAAGSLLFAAVYMVLDVLYTTQHHVYREVIAYTGIAVFYATLIGIGLALFIKSPQTFILCVSLTMSCVMVSVSLHGIYVYFDVTYNDILVTHLQNVVRDGRLLGPSLMHFGEAVVSLLALCFYSTLGLLLGRLLYLDARRIINLQPIWYQLVWLYRLGAALCCLVMLELVLCIIIREGWDYFHTTVQYNVCDFIYTFSIGLFQIWISRASRRHVQNYAIVLLLMLGGSIIFTYSYLNLQTSHIHVIIIFMNQIEAATNSVLLPSVRQMTPVILGHVAYIIQLLLMISSLLVAGVLVEKVFDSSLNFEISLPLTGDGEVINFDNPSFSPVDSGPQISTNYSRPANCSDQNDISVTKSSEGPDVSHSSVSNGHYDVVMEEVTDSVADIHNAVKFGIHEPRSPSAKFNPSVGRENNGETSCLRPVTEPGIAESLIRAEVEERRGNDATTFRLLPQVHGGNAIFP